MGMSWEETQSHSRKAKRKFDERQSGSEGWNGMEQGDDREQASGVSGRVTEEKVKAY